MLQPRVTVDFGIRAIKRWSPAPKHLLIRALLLDEVYRLTQDTPGKLTRLFRELVLFSMDMPSIQEMIFGDFHACLMSSDFVVYLANGDQ